MGWMARPRVQEGPMLTKSSLFEPAKTGVEEALWAVLQLQTPVVSYQQLALYDASV